MGNDNSSFVYISTNSYAYRPGDLVQGEVFVKLLEPVSATCLKIKLAGSESTDFFTNGEFQHGRCDFFRYEKDLYFWPVQGAVIGDYVFQFSIKLPLEVPASTEVEILGIKASIIYTLEASLTEDLHFSTPLQINSAVLSSITPNQISRSISIKSCYCFTRGTVNYSITTNKHEYTCNEVIKISISGDRSNISAIVMRLYRTVLVSSDEGLIMVSKDALIEIETAENNVDIDLNAVVDRLTNKTTTNGKHVRCMYSLNFTEVSTAFCTRDYSDMNIVINIVSNDFIPKIPRCSITWRPKYVRENQADDQNPDEDSYLI